MEKALWREVLGQVRTWGSEVLTSFRVLPPAKLGWLWVRLGKPLWLEMLRDHYRDEMVSLSAEPRLPENPAGLLPICSSASPGPSSFLQPVCFAPLRGQQRVEKRRSLRGKGSSDQVTCDPHDLQAGLELELFHTLHSFFF